MSFYFLTWSRSCRWGTPRGWTPPPTASSSRGGASGAQGGGRPWSPGKQKVVRCCYFCEFFLLSYLALECDAAPGLGDDLAVLGDDLHLGADWKKRMETINLTWSFSVEIEQFVNPFSGKHQHWRIERKIIYLTGSFALSFHSYLLELRFCSNRMLINQTT